MVEYQIGTKILNVSLRVASLAAKLVLTLYMARYLGLSDLGVYGLVFASVTISAALLGLQLDYVIARDLVGATAHESLCKIRDQVSFYFINYGVFALLVLSAYFLQIAAPKTLLAVFLLATMENLSSILSANLISMGRPVLATFLSFIRYGVWCLVAVFLGVLWPSFRSVDVVLNLWVCGEITALVLIVWAWRNLPWKTAMRTPIDWVVIKCAVCKSFPIWLGTAGSVLALSLDRFVVSYYLDMEKVGVITFYSSFANALLSLVQSGFFAFSFPRLIQHFQDGQRELFKQESTQMGIQVFVTVLVLAGVLGVIIPYAAPYFNKPELAAEVLTLWLLLVAVWIRANADTFYYILYAQRRDRPLWIGGILVLIPAAVGNLVFVPWVGLSGVGYSAILSSLLGLVWRVSHVLKPTEKIFYESKSKDESIKPKMAEFLD